MLSFRETASGLVAGSLAVAALLACDVTASAQDRPTARPARMAHMTPHAKRMAGMRPLTVRRRVAALPPAVVEGPVPVANTGPGTLVTVPLGFGSTVVSLPFRILGGIFPAESGPNLNPLVLIGAPLRAAGDIAQVPFRIVGAPFGGTTIATY